MDKTKISAALIALLLILVPLGVLASISVVVGGAVIGLSSTVSNLPSNCKAPSNIFETWTSFDSFISGGDCNGGCATANVSGEGTFNTAGRTENIQTIIGVGNAMKIPEKGIVIALVTAIQESGIKNYANDGEYDLIRNPADETLKAKAPSILSFIKKSMSFPHDAVGSDASSVGIFQQQAWWGTVGGSNWETDPDGTIKRLMDPTFQSQKFYNALLGVNGWQDLPPGVAAQKVQVSAFPDAYAGRLSEAQSLYNQNKDSAKSVTLYDFGAKEFTGETGATAEGSSSSCSATASTTGIVLQKSALYQVTAQFAQPRGSELNGGHAGMDIDCGNDWEKVFTPVSGVVTVAVNGNPSGYGEPAGQVQVKAEDGTVIWLYHMRNVFVKAGSQVAGGDPVGECASTGLSTGTHLHIQADISKSTNPKVKALQVAQGIGGGFDPNSLRDPALVLDVLGVDICPPYTSNRKTAIPGSPLPGSSLTGGIMKCWPKEEWTK